VFLDGLVGFGTRRLSARCRWAAVAVGYRAEHPFERHPQEAACSCSASTRG